MKPVDFTLHRPGALDEALSLLAEYGEDGKVLAGGQSLIPLLNFRLARPEHVIDVGTIASLSEVRRTRDELRVGAMARQAFAERSSGVARHCPLLTAALPHVAHPPIRSRGTVGGSLAHADPSAELPSVARALDATFVAQNVAARREIPAAEFFHTHLVTALEPDELLTEIRFPAAPPGTGAAFREVSRRRGDFALVGVAVQLTVDGASIVDARIAFSGVSDVPYRCREAEGLLAGRAPGNDVLRDAAQVARETLTPAADLHATADYRRDVAATLLCRAITDAYDQATADAASPAA